MHHKRKLNFKDFENNPEGSIWSLFWYGRISFNKNQSRFYIEAYLVLMSEDNYFLTSIDKNRVEKLVIPFTKSILFPLCTQFDHEGRFLRMSSMYNNEGDLLRNGLYRYDNLWFSNEYNFRVNGLEEFFSDSLFPEVFENGTSIYQNAPHFRRVPKINEEQADQNRDKNIFEFFIPVDVILRYFFGFSALTFDLLITDSIKKAIFDVSYNEETKRGSLFYDSNLISREDVDSIAKYFFTKNDFAIKMIDKIGTYFSAFRINGENPNAFIKFKLPFDDPCSLSVVGQFFKNIDGFPKIKRFLVNEIVSISGIDDFLLTKDDIDITDINVSESSENVNGENETKPGNTRNSGNSKSDNDEESDDLPQNPYDNDKIITAPVELRKCFDQGPKINHLVRMLGKNDEYVYVSDNRPNDHSDFSNSGTNNTMRNYSNVNWTAIFYETIEYLVQEYGYVANCLSERGTDKRIVDRIIYELKYKEVNYYIVETGGNNYFPLFRSQNGKDKIDVGTICEIIAVIKNVFKSSWLVLANKKSLKDNKKFTHIDFLQENDITFLRNNIHDPHTILVDGVDLVDIPKSIEKQAKKIHAKILSDLKKLPKN